MDFIYLNLAFIIYINHIANNAVGLLYANMENIKLVADNVGGLLYANTKKSENGVLSVKMVLFYAFMINKNVIVNNAADLLYAKVIGVKQLVIKNSMGIVYFVVLIYFLILKYQETIKQKRMK
jgi:hypothetical protein